MTFTKKHYEHVAAYVRNNVLLEEDKKVFVSHLVAMFKKDSESFKEDLFRKKSGVE